jgi:hypothetical protein
VAFVIDSSEWNFNNLDAQSVSQKLEQLLERLDVASERGESVYVGDDLQSRCVSSTMDLWVFLNDDSMKSIDRGILEELSAFFNYVNYYENDDSLWPTNFLDQTVLDKDNNKLGLDIAFIHFNILSGKPYGCISLSEEQNLETNSQFGRINIDMINDEKSHKNFWRTTALTLARDTAKNLEDLSPHMYPNLIFIEGVWNGINHFDGGYARVSQNLQKYLAGLDDFGAWIFTEPPPAVHPTDTVTKYTGSQPTNAIIVQRFSGIGLEMAPEKPDVFKNKRCREAREITFNPNPKNGQTDKLFCEWHGKFEKHINRIHIHPPVNASNGKIIIAIYNNHLPLPG